MKSSVIHILIIWSEADKFKDHIVNHISGQFEIYKIFKVHWDKKEFYNNLNVFYSHSLKDYSLDKVEDILKNKIKSIGRSTFTAVIFEDKSPNFVDRMTTSGNQNVNSNVFDLKVELRKMVGGSSRIHCSNDSWETNKDLSILFGLNTSDFCNKYANHSLIEENWYSNCIGVNGYDSIEQLFYILNNTINYCVLRNHECIPNEYTVEGHGDIDLLVEHRNYAVRLTNAKPVYPLSYRVYHILKIAGKSVPIDFRHIGDDYYDQAWERDILSTRVFTKNLFYIPNPINQYYSLLYHAYIQKPYVKPDYPPKLSLYADAIGISYSHNVIESVRDLFSFLKNNGYTLTRAQDKSVYYNTANIKKIDVYNFLKEKVGIKDLVSCYEDLRSLSDFYYFKGVYNNKPVFIKYGGIGGTCINEFKRTLSAYEYDPKHFIHPYVLDNNNDDWFIIYEWVEGEPLERYAPSADERTKIEIKKQLIDIYDDLYKLGIMHRDIRPSNILIVDGILKLIDFQYAIDAQNPVELEVLKNNIHAAKLLGNKNFKYKPYAWRDSASILKVMEYIGVDTTDVYLKKDKVYRIPLCKYLFYILNCYYKRLRRHVKF